MILDLFAGCGGWSEGLHGLGLADVGIEWDAAACATRSAAGHATIRADVEHYPPERFAGRVEGLIASPPCQDFSMAGGRAGVGGESGRLVVQALRWAQMLRPEWLVFEQVPPVLPIWQHYANELRFLGYSTWTGILNAADFGVPQTRKRAFLLASRIGPALPSPPTHARVPVPLLWGELRPWVSMADALRWGLVARPGFTFCGSNEGGPDLAGGSGAREAIRSARQSGSWVVDRRTVTNGKPTVPVSTDRPASTLTGNAGGQWQVRPWCYDRPATTVAGDPRLANPGWRGRPEDYDADGIYTGKRSMDDAIRLTIRDALILQGFRPDYPVAGTKTKQFEQVGNAVPPPLAAAVIRAMHSVVETTR